MSENKKKNALTISIGKRKWRVPSNRLLACGLAGEVTVGGLAIAVAGAAVKGSRAMAIPGVALAIPAMIGGMAIGAVAGVVFFGERVDDEEEDDQADDSAPVEPIDPAI